MAPFKRLIYEKVLISRLLPQSIDEHLEHQPLRFVR